MNIFEKKIPRFQKDASCIKQWSCVSFGGLMFLRVLRPCSQDPGAGLGGTVMLTPVAAGERGPSLPRERGDRGCQKSLRGTGLWVGCLRRFRVHLTCVPLEGGSSLVGVPSVSAAGGAARDEAVTLAVAERGAGLLLCGCLYSVSSPFIMGQGPCLRLMLIPTRGQPSPPGARTVPRGQGTFLPE